MKHYAPTVSLSTILSCSSGNLFTILLQLTKSEATSCNGFRDSVIGSFRCSNLQRTLIKKCKSDNYFFFNFHQVIHSLPSISCPILELLAVTVFEISYFLLKFAKGNNSIKLKWFFFNFSPRCLLVMLYKLTKLEAPSCNGFLRYQVFYVKICEGQ